MAFSRPYQPLLLRILHGLTGLFLVMAMLTAFWTYDVYDGRWGTLSLPDYKAIEGIHGTFGLYTLLIFPAFVIYAFNPGKKRLIQANSWSQLASQLAQRNRSVGWYALSRMTNTLALLALTFALFSGKMMDSTWLPNGELNHTWYYAHLISWIVMAVAIAMHLLLLARVGGKPLLLSMMDRYFHEKDAPKHWPTHISHYLSKSWSHNWQNFWQSRLLTPSILKVLETVILASIVVAWIMSLAKELSSMIGSSS